MPTRIIAIDWSGAKEKAERKIWLAEATPGDRPVISRLENGRDRTAIVNHLIELAAEAGGLIVGLDFAFSLPSWFLVERGLRSAPELWELVDREGEQWLAECEPPFWGRSGKLCPTGQEQYRRTDRKVPTVGSSRPKSVFQINGNGAVGTGSLRGMPILKRLRSSGFTTWPFDAPGRHVLVEIYPRLLTGVVNKGDAVARDAYLRRHYPWLDTEVRVRATCSDDAFDATVSALVMARHHAELTALTALPDEIDQREGRIWWPADESPSDALCDRAPFIEYASRDSRAGDLPSGRRAYTVTTDGSPTHVRTAPGFGRSTRGATTRPGFVNRNSQEVLRATELRGSDHNSRTYVLRCQRCEHEYGANGTDIFQRRCPHCQGGAPGSPL